MLGRQLWCWDSMEMLGHIYSNPGIGLQSALDHVSILRYFLFYMHCTLPPIDHGTLFTSGHIDWAVTV
jgi:hypothetical protein